MKRKKQQVDTRVSISLSKYEIVAVDTLAQAGEEVRKFVAREDIGSREFYSYRDAGKVLAERGGDRARVVQRAGVGE